LEVHSPRRRLDAFLWVGKLLSEHWDVYNAAGTLIISLREE
jgi:hypothetical protein